MSKGSVAKRKADDAERGRLRSLDHALEDKGLKPHFVYDWTIRQHPKLLGTVVADDDWTVPAVPSTAGLEDLL